MQKHLNIKIFGRVQGVNFRNKSKREAEKLSIAGFAENRNGGVYIEAEGEEKMLKKFLNWCKKGPASAKVELVEVEEGELVHHIGFEVKYW